MRPKYKVTGCARFFLFLIIFVPLVFFGAAYVRGEDGLQIIRDFYHNITGQSGSSSDESKKETYSADDVQRQLDEANKKIEKLEQQLREKEQEIARLKDNGQ